MNDRDVTQPHSLPREAQLILVDEILYNMYGSYKSVCLEHHDIHSNMICIQTNIYIYIYYIPIHVVEGVSRNDAYTCIGKQSIEGTLNHDLSNCHCKTILTDYQIEPPRHSLGQL